MNSTDVPLKETSRWSANAVYMHVRWTHEFHLITAHSFRNASHERTANDFVAHLSRHETNFHREAIFGGNYSLSGSGLRSVEFTWDGDAAEKKKRNTTLRGKCVGMKTVRRCATFVCFPHASDHFDKHVTRTPPQQ